jgi:hypothetical protein
MLLSSKPDLTEVWCETYNDVVLVWENAGSETIEFVQVKAENPDQLWTPAYLCKREKLKKEANGLGTSVLEKSLARDNCEERTQFRLVTTRDVISKLELLKRDRSHSDRRRDSASMVELHQEFGHLVGGFKSEKGNDYRYWLEGVLWEVHTRDALENSNKLLIMKILEEMQLDAYSDTIEAVYQDLLTLVKTAAEQPWCNRDQKMIKAPELRAFIENSVSPYPLLSQNKKLEAKMSSAGLDVTYIETAKELRRTYLTEMRSRRYLEIESLRYYTIGVLNRLLRLRSDFDSGLIRADGVHFHAECLRNIQQLIDGRPSTIKKPPEGFVDGCMYDITSRCKHRFTRLTL